VAVPSFVDVPEPPSSLAVPSEVALDDAVPVAEADAEATALAVEVLEATPGESVVAVEVPVPPLLFDVPDAELVESEIVVDVAVDEAELDALPVPDAEALAVKEAFDEEVADPAELPVPPTFPTPPLPTFPMPPFELELAVEVESEVAEEEEVEVAVAEFDAVPEAINQACLSKPFAVIVPVESGHPPSHLATALAELTKYKTVDDWVSAELSSSP